MWLNIYIHSAPDGALAARCTVRGGGVGSSVGSELFTVFPSHEKWRSIEDMHSAPSGALAARCTVRGGGVGSSVRSELFIVFPSREKRSSIGATSPTVIFTDVCVGMSTDILDLGAVRRVS